MAAENTWVTYLNRSYKSIKASILSRMQSIVPEITDHSESNILVIIIGAFAGLVEQLNYYIDNVARETYISTARRYSSLIKLTRLIDYRVRANIGSTVDLVVTAVDGSGNPFNVTSNVLINAGSIITTGTIEFITLKNRTIFIGSASVTIPCRQRLLVSGSNIGTTTALANQAFRLDDAYQDGTLQIVINSLSWELKNTFAFSGPDDRHFIVEVNEAKEMYAVFGDDVNGAIPPLGQSVLATFYKCFGLAGNVAADTITTWVSGEPSGGGASDFTVTNPAPATGGLDIEDLERIRKHASLTLRTLDRAVTLQDHNDIALLVPGVGKAATSFNSNLKEINIYVTPEEGGVASGALLDDVEEYFQTRQMISTLLIARAAGESYLRIKITATAKFRRSGSDTQADIIAALLTSFGFNGSDVNKDIRKSDIIALVDNLDKVDYLVLDYLTHKPYPRILVGTNEIYATWKAVINSTLVTKTVWRLVIISNSTREARLYRKVGLNNEVFDSTYMYQAAQPGSPDHTSADGTISIGVGGTFTNGDQWVFTTYPYNEDIEFDDFSVPVTIAAELDITVEEQNI